MYRDSGALQCYLRLGIRSVRFALPLAVEDGKRQHRAILLIKPMTNTFTFGCPSGNTAWGPSERSGPAFRVQAAEPGRCYVASRSKKGLRGFFSPIGPLAIKV